MGSSSPSRAGPTTSRSKPWRRGERKGSWGGSPSTQHLAPSILLKRAKGRKGEAPTPSTQHPASWVGALFFSCATPLTESHGAITLAAVFESERGRLCLLLKLLPEESGSVSRRGTTRGGPARSRINGSFSIPCRLPTKVR